MITLDNAELRVATWISTVSARQIVLSRLGQQGVPGRPYATIFMQAVRQISLPDVKVLTGGAQETINALYALDFMFDLYRGNVRGDYRKLALSLYAYDRHFDLYDGGQLGISLIGEQRDLSSVVASNFKPRLNFELTFYANLEETFTSEVIEKFDLTTKVDELDYKETIELTNIDPFNK